MSENQNTDFEIGDHVTSVFHPGSSGTVTGRRNCWLLVSIDNGLTESWHPDITAKINSPKAGE